MTSKKEFRIESRDRSHVNLPNNDGDANFPSIEDHSCFTKEYWGSECERLVGWFMVFNTNSAIIQLYHGENKLILLMLMKGDLVWPYEFEFWNLNFGA